MPRFSRITKTVIHSLVREDDLDEGLYHFQNAIGITTGDVAGVMFSGDLAAEWVQASAARRMEIVEDYIAAERRAAQHSVL